MLRIVQFELKKMLLRPISIIIFIVIITINIISLFLSSDGSIVQRQDLALQRIEQSKYAGDINPSWTNAIQEKLQIITENPNHLSYRILLDANQSSDFYNHALQFAINEKHYYKFKFEGKKGDALSTKAEEMYGDLATNYTAFYDYNLGWIKLNAMQNLMPFTVGLFLLIAISPIFALEYSEKMDSLLLTSKYGKNKLIYAKIIAAFLLAIGSWLIIQMMNLSIVSWLFGLQGGRTFVQDWIYNSSPFPLTQLTYYFAVTFISLIGVLSFTSIVIIVSTKAKSPFISLLVSGMMLLFPVMGDISRVVGFLNNLWPYMPSQMLMAVNHFRFFQSYYVFGHVFLMQHVVPVVALIAMALIILITYRTFKRRQVAN